MIFYPSILRRSLEVVGTCDRHKYGGPSTYFLSIVLQRYIFGWSICVPDSQ